jgi:Zn-dependent M28 family amino/carboxypeptidase
MKITTMRICTAASMAAIAVLCAVIGAQKFAAAAASGDAVDEAMASIRPEAIRADMEFLADDLLEGRGTATRGHELAAKFMAAQFEQMGLEPAGNGGTFFQGVPLREFRADEEKTTVTLVTGGTEWKLANRKDYLVHGSPLLTKRSLEAPVIYVGYGVTAPEQRYDDYKGVDAKGKVVAVIFGAPPSFEGSLRAHYSSGEKKAANAVAHGAIGIIGLDDPVLEQIYSFQQQVDALVFPNLAWLDPQGRPNAVYPQLKGGAYLSMGATKRFFEGSAHSADEVFAAAKAGKQMSFDLPWTFKFQGESNWKDKQSPNVVAKLPGSDPALREEYVVYTAHLDHLGIGVPVNGDNIYNGALDNGSGSADLIEIARAFSRMNPRPKRSILFVSVTAEEEGLLGSDYFAHFPTVKKNAIVANVNMDEDLMLWPMEDLIVFGAEHSSLSQEVNEAAARLHLAISPDTQPEQVFFIRSDQYSFVKQGVPAIAAGPGTMSHDPKYNAKEIEEKWEQNIYHHPQDDMNQPFLFEEGAKYARFDFLVGYLVAQKKERPAWNKGDFFGEHAGKE